MKDRPRKVFGLSEAKKVLALDPNVDVPSVRLAVGVLGVRDTVVADAQRLCAAYDSDIVGNEAQIETVVRAGADDREQVHKKVAAIEAALSARDWRRRGFISALQEAIRMTQEERTDAESVAAKFATDTAAAT